MSTFAELTPVSRKVVAWILTACLQDLTDRGFTLDHHSCENERYLCVSDTKLFSGFTKIKTMFAAKCCNTSDETTDIPAFYGGLEWAYIDDSLYMRLEPNMRNAISWFRKTKNTANEVDHAHHLGETSNILPGAWRKAQLYDDLRKMLLVGEIVHCPDCSLLIRNLIGQLAWSS